MPEPPKPTVDEQSIRAEFARRRTREQIAATLFNLALVASLVGISAAAQSEVLAKTLICAVPLIFASRTIGMIVFSATNWCCPACNHYLASSSSRISPFFTPEPLKCPSCRVKLR